MADNPKQYHPLCYQCGWRRGGPDSWDGKACKCKVSEPPVTRPIECSRCGLVDLLAQCCPRNDLDCPLWGAK